MATVFRFIDNNNIAPSAVDIATRKRIRSHAATGKNAGRKVHRPSRIAALKAQKQQQHQGNIMSGSNSVWERCLTKLHDDEEDAGEVVKSTPQGKRTQPFLVDQEHSSQKMWAMLAKQYKTLHRVMGQGRAGLDFILPVPLSCRKWALSTSSVAAAQRYMSYFLSIRYFPELRDAMYNPASSPSIWLSLVFSDEAYFHIAMAAATMLLSQIPYSSATAESSRASIKHLSRTLQLVNTKLTSNDFSVSSKTEKQHAEADTIMAVVIMMAQYERHQGRWFQGLVHLRGLQRMVELRGGIARVFAENPVVAHKILRLDLEYAIHAGATTHFRNGDFAHLLRTVLTPSLDYSGLESSTSSLLQHSRSRVHRDGIPVSVESDLHTIFQDTVDASDLVNATAVGASGTQRINLHDFLHTLLSLGYRLVQLRPLGASCWAVDTLGTQATSRDGLTSPDSVDGGEHLISQDTADNTVLGEIVHLGLYAWLLRFMHRLDGVVEDIPRLNELAQHCAEVVLRQIPTNTAVGALHGHGPNGQICPQRDVQAELLLWLLFLVASLGFQRRPHHPWLVARVKQVLDRLGLCDRRGGWESARAVLRQFAWVDNLHGSCAQELWRDALAL